MRIAISGHSGFIGTNLLSYYQNQPVDFVKIDRQDFQKTDEALSKKLEGSHVIINLAGAPIVQRWTKKARKSIYNSRIKTTEKISKAIEAMEQKPELFICASAVGIYKTDNQKPHDENNSQLSRNFLGKVCADWENAALIVSQVTRVVNLRLGLVLGSNGGLIKKMRKSFQLGFGVYLGNGAQPFPWIYIVDLIKMIDFIIKNPQISGAVNAVSPELISHKTFIKKMGIELKTYVLFRIPSFFIRLILGKASILLTDGQKVIPKKTLINGFNFTYKTIEETLHQILNKDKKSKAI